MPRIPDPELEQRVVQAALRLLETEGIHAVTMRAVASEARTTTPTIYERFADREKLLEEVTGEATLQLLGAVRQARSVSDFVKRVLEFSLQHSKLSELPGTIFGVRLSTGQPMPIYELLKDQITREVGLYGPKREQLAMAVVITTIGTLRTMLAAGIDTPAAKELHHTGVSTVEVLLKLFKQQAALG